MLFRPASLSLEQLPIAIHSSPDGSCLLASYPTNLGQPLFRAYHWATFGSSPGISLDSVDLPSGSSTIVLTSMVNRNSIHLVGLDPVDGRCQSFALDISRKVTEFTFKEKGVKGSSSQAQTHATAHNCLIDCHSDVWTRFPVVPAVQRQTMQSSSRVERRLTFFTDYAHDRFAPHFADLIRTFELRTKKPTGDVLKTTRILTTLIEQFVSDIGTGIDWDVSQFHLGEWLVDVLCLIPIQVAVTRDNRFLPLRDGVMSAELEKTLLGADVGRIVDSLSLGWYESIFQSYMASKVSTVFCSKCSGSYLSFSLSKLCRPWV